MRNLVHGGRLIVLVIVLALLLTGCTSRSIVNPGWTVVAVDEGTLYSVLATGKVVALDAASGSEKWVYPIQQASSGGLGGLFSRPAANQDSPLNAVYGVPIFTPDQVIVGSFDNSLYAFDKNSGQKAWVYTSGGPIVGGAAEYDGNIYFGASDNRVYAIKPGVSAAELLWNPVVTQHGIWGVPAVNEQYVVVGSLDHHVYALDRQTGEIVWEHDMGAAVAGDITIANDLVYVGGTAKKLTALRLSTGEVAWEQQFGQWVWGDALNMDGTIFVSSLDGQVHALDAMSGTVKWDAQLDGATRAGLILAGDYLVIGTDKGNVYRIETGTGKAELLFQIANATVLAKAAVQGTQVYVGTSLATIISLDSTKVGGTPLWTYPAATK